MSTDFTDLVGQAISGATDVLSAQYNARGAGVVPTRDAGLDSVNRPQNVQASAGAYGSSSNGLPSWAVWGGVLVGALVLIMVLKK